MKTLNKQFSLWITEVITALFVLLFVYAAINKIKDFEEFQVQLGKSPLLNVFYKPVSILVPALELVITIGLLIKRTQFFGLIASFTLMVLFSAYIVAILHFSEYIPCSCGGVLQNMNWSQHLIFNIVFVTGGAVAVLLYPSRQQELNAQ